MKRKIVFSFLVLVALTVTGHEFWIQPDKFIYKRGETINVKFLVGDNFAGDAWGGDRNNVSSLRYYFADVIDTNLNDNLGMRKGDSLQLAMLEEGTAMITLHTKNSFIDLDAKEFNEYLREDGLVEALAYRIKHGDTLKSGHEFYQRSVKTIFQVGDKKTDPYKHKTELPLDIVPAEHPYNVAKDGNFKVKVFFMGEKLKKTKVRVWHRLDDKVNNQEYTTDEDGEIKFFLSPEGEWMISCVKMVRLESDPRAEWQSYWGSLTWGYY